MGPTMCQQDERNDPVCISVLVLCEHHILPSLGCNPLAHPVWEYAGEIIRDPCRATKVTQHNSEVVFEEHIWNWELTHTTLLYKEEM